MVGIYKITNTINNKSYIGQSINIASRWAEHKRLSNSEDQRIIYRAIRKYGLENFTFEVLEECQEQELNEREIYWINFFDSFENGYNMTYGGDGSRKYDIIAIVESYKRTENIVQTAKEFSCHPTTVRNIIHSFGLYGKESQSKPVEQIDPVNLQVINTYSSIREAATSLNVSQASIQRAINGKNVHSGGFYWRLVGDTNKEFSPIKKMWKKRVQRVNKETHIVIDEYESCAEAARALGKDAKNGGSQISRAAKGGKPTAFGYIWKYS